MARRSCGTRPVAGAPQAPVILCTPQRKHLAVAVGLGTGQRPILAWRHTVQLLGMAWDSLSQQRPLTGVRPSRLWLHVSCSAVPCYGVPCNGLGVPCISYGMAVPCLPLLTSAHGKAVQRDQAGGWSPTSSSHTLRARPRVRCHCGEPLPGLCGQ